MDWTDNATQTRGIRKYSPLMYSIVVVNIVLPMDATNIDVTRVEDDLRLYLTATEI